MNILMFTWRDLKHPNAGGAEISTHEHAKRWVKLGHKVTLFTSTYKNAQGSEFINGIRIIRKGQQVGGVHLAAFKWFIFDNKEQFDIVIDQFHGIPFFTPLYIPGIKLAFIHEVTKDVWRLNPWPVPFRQIVSLIGQICEPLIFKLLYKSVPFMTVSKSTEKDLLEWGIPKDNIKIIHNGCKINNDLRLLSKEVKKTVIYLGALSKDKGIEDALKIFTKVSEKVDNWQLWVVGKAEKKYLKKIKTLADNIGIKEKVKFFGYVSENKKFSLLSKAHILICPSIREGWGLVVIEAAGVGIPAVGYNVAGLKDSIIHNKTGILCDANPQACSNAILDIMSKEEKYNKLRQNCYKWSKKFNWDTAGRESLNLLNKIVNQKNV